MLQHAETEVGLWSGFTLSSVTIDFVWCPPSENVWSLFLNSVETVSGFSTVHNRFFLFQFPWTAGFPATIISGKRMGVYCALCVWSSKRMLELCCRKVLRCPSLVVIVFKWSSSWFWFSTVVKERDGFLRPLFSAHHTIPPTAPANIKPAANETDTRIARKVAIGSEFMAGDGDDTSLSTVEGVSWLKSFFVGIKME